MLFASSYLGQRARSSQSILSGTGREFRDTLLGVGVQKEHTIVLYLQVELLLASPAEIACSIE